MSAEEIIANLRTRAANLRRYPFYSATMGEAARLAAAALEELACEYDVKRTPTAIGGPT